LMLFGYFYLSLFIGGDHKLRNLRNYVKI